MKDRFNSYFQEKKLFLETDRVLLAISGGKDSIAMLNLFMVNELSFGIAHCNFQLRGEDANHDQCFVSEFSSKHNIPFYTIAFDTKKYAADKGISIQMAARELRYDWFEKIRKENNFKYIATAHHKNDVAETMLINMTQGKGLAGLHGISYKRGAVIRPMLDFERAEIDDYVKVNDLPFREDSSNSDTKYTRNAIRHKVLPKLEKINPAIIDTLNTASQRFLGDEKIISDKIAADKKKLFKEIGSGFKIRLEDLKKYVPLNSYLYYFFRDYGFNSFDISNIITSFNEQSGKQFFSKTHRIIRDRDFLLLTKIEESFKQEFKIEAIEDFPFNYQLIDIKLDFKMETSRNYAYLDADKIQYPLVLRSWKQGDVFQPFGMRGKKKVSDFLINNKVSLLDKEKIEVLAAKGEILWLVGFRISDRYKVTQTTKRVLVLKSNWQ